jgi:organic radical activating enzyme
VYIDVTSECNWGCDYCNAITKNTTGDISKALTVSRLFALRTLGLADKSVKFIITGGEPSIYGLKYNQSIIKGLRVLNTQKVYIEYASNMSADIEFYNNLDVDGFLFSYHQQYMTPDEFIEKFDKINGYKIVRVNDKRYEQFPGNIVSYQLNGVDDDNVFFEYDAPKIYELRQKRILTRNGLSDKFDE